MRDYLAESNERFIAAIGSLSPDIADTIAQTIASDAADEQKLWRLTGRYEKSHKRLSAEYAIVVRASARQIGRMVIEDTGPFPGHYSGISPVSGMMSYSELESLNRGERGNV